MIDGQYLDERTLAVTVLVVTYNGGQDSLAFTTAQLFFMTDSVEVVGRTSAIPVMADTHRRVTAIALTAAFTPFVAAALLLEARHFLGVLTSGKWRHRKLRKRLWNVIVLLHALCVTGALALWWALLGYMRDQADAGLVYPILDNPTGSQPRRVVIYNAHPS